jgi:hypothetical protein
MVQPTAIENIQKKTVINMYRHSHLYSIRYFKLSKDDLKCMGRCIYVKYKYTPSYYEGLEHPQFWVFLEGRSGDQCPGTNPLRIQEETTYST